MRHLLSQHVVKAGSSASFRIDRSIFGLTPARNLCLTLLVVCIVLLSSSVAQVSLLTSRGDNARAGANTNETLLTPSNVNASGFGRLFSFPVDYVVMAQPLYVPNVDIPGQGTHNVVYVVTQADSVYAIDADTGAQLWYASMLNGGTTASGGYLPCGTGGGFYQEGIPGTPVIDTTTMTIYLVAKTVLNATVRHHLHALDITTGKEQPGSPVLIAGQTTSKKGHVMVFNSLYQKNRPGLLLANGLLYMGFGSNYCNDRDSGWVFSYDSASLSKRAIFNTSPDYGLTSIWQTGNGLAADEEGNIYVETAETGAHGFDVPTGGQTYCNSVVKLSPNLEVADYFTPWSVAFLNNRDLDLSSTGVLILPDQEGAHPHELIASGKQGFVYVLDRDQMGTYSVNDSGAIQEFGLIPGETTDAYNDVMFSSPAYWNKTVYFAPNNATPMAFPLSGGLLGSPRTTTKNLGAHSPSISANGTTNGILWVISGTQLLAFDAVSLQLLYGTNQALNKRDRLPPVGHFVTQTVVNGKVYVATQTSLEAYGLLNVITVTGGNAQTATVATALPAPIKLQATNPYNGQPDIGATVNFSDGCKIAGSTSCGSFNPPSAVTDSNGTVSTIYTVPKKAGTYTLTISATGFGNVTTTATATPGAAQKIIYYRGAKQTGAAGSNLANPLVAQARDVYNNGVPGITVNFTANHGAIPNPSSAVTDANGLAGTVLRLPTTVSTITVTGSSVFNKISFAEYSVAGPAAKIAITSGNNQFATAGTQLPQGLTVLVTDQYGNPVAGNSVAFSDGGAGGTFSGPNPAVADTTGTVTQLYTLPSSPGTVTITAAATGVATPATFTETGQ
jgi:hypothetical protein